ncbi:DNA methyltransferase [Gordonia phage Geodirt]|uniref:DNA methylase n=1 Tax=Gordonia phage Geodirt TaxID=2483670 RepID=A0A3G3MA15_9CAUD|nr:DNA methyltransferase [Gordonia phage Geodirt]AYR02898.1 hypothetical protein SEA_GEODIRT_4 [Gordonia phage Geodirt]
MPEHIARWNPSRMLWETETLSLFSAHSEPYSETLPTSGMTRNGALLPLPKSVPATSDSECSSSPTLPTPRATDGTKGGQNQRGSSGDLMLPSAVQPGNLLPTPNSANGTQRTRSAEAIARGDHQANLTDLPRMLPTPRGRDHKGATASRAGDGHDLPSALLPTPEAKLANSGPDFARADRDGSGGDDLITTAARAERAESWGKYAGAIARAERAVGRPAPSPTEPNRNNKPRLNAAFAEWMMMLPAGHVTDPAIKLSRSDQLKAIGNGVCPPQAYAAILRLIEIARTA